MLTQNDILKMAVDIAKAYAESPTKQGIGIEEVLERVYKKLKELNKD